MVVFRRFLVVRCDCFQCFQVINIFRCTKLSQGHLHHLTLGFAPHLARWCQCSTCFLQFRPRNLPCPWVMWPPCQMCTWEKAGEFSSFSWVGVPTHCAGVAIGAVFASEKYVCPNAVGVDIGCGMCAVPIKGLYKDDLTQEDLRQLQSFLATVLHVFHLCFTSIFSERLPNGYVC